MRRSGYGSRSTLDAWTASLLFSTCLFLAQPAAAVGTPEQACQAAKNSAAGIYAACLHKAEKSLATGGDPMKYASAVATCRSKLETKWSKAEGKAADGGATCPDAPLAVDDYESAIDAHVANITAALNGMPLRNCPSDLASCQSTLTTCQSQRSSCESGTASAADVVAGRTFSSASGLGLAGSMTNRGSANFTPSTSAQSIPSGYYSGGQVNGDSDLTAANIAAGITIFDTIGTGSFSTGNATAAQVLSGEVFSNAGASGIAGTMPNVGQQNITPGAAAVAILQGYHDGSGGVAGDNDLVQANIKSGVDLFGVTGTAVAASGDATAADVLTGKTFSNASGSATGSMPDNGAVVLVASAANQSIAAGYHNGSGVCAGDSDLIPANIVNTVNVFGVVGTALTAQRFKTGQTGCYDSAGTSIPCAGTGQDGEFQKGITQEFVDNGDGTISDVKTGLMWEKLVQDGSLHAVAATYASFAAAQAKIVALNGAMFAGYSDWRIPNILELQSLAIYTGASPAISSVFHNSCAPGCTFATCSCTIPDGRYVASTWSHYLDFTSGLVSPGTGNRVRAVRGGV